MAVTLDGQIKEVYDQIRSAKDDTDWMLCGYEDNKTIKLVGSGSGGVDALAQNVQNDGCYYGYVRVTIKSDETTRTKFVLISFKGDTAPVMRKGKMSVHISDVKKVLKDFTVSYDASEVSDLSEAKVSAKVSAANY